MSKDHQCKKLKDYQYTLRYYESDGYVLYDDSEELFSLRFMEYCPYCGLKLEE